MRTLRLILYFFVGSALSAIVVPAFAEDYPAVVYWAGVQTEQYTFPDPLSACLSKSSNTQFVTQTAPTAAYCKRTLSTGAISTITSVGGSYLCLGGGTLKNVNGVQMCTNAPACTPPQVRDSTTGQCIDPLCPTSGTGTGSNESSVSPGFSNLYGWYDPAATMTKGGAGTYCSSGCSVSFQATVCVPSSEPGTNNCAALNTTYTGSTCTGTTAPVISGSTAKPPCATGEGVVTMGGKVACVPTGASPDIPKVNKSSSTQSYPDGSTKIINTTTTCSGAGACSTTTTTTITGATSGSNAGGAGQAGTPGTTTDEEDEEGDTFCAKNPTLQICKGGISEEGTQKQVLTEVKKLTSVDSNTDKTAITNAGKYAETPGYQASKDADDNLVKYASGITKNGEVEASKTTFEQALSSGFWTDIPTVSCTTPTYVIAGHEIEWDRWCEIVGMIQEIGAYGMWVMLAISIFVMLSGGRQT